MGSYHTHLSDICFFSLRLLPLPNSIIPGQSDDIAGTEVMNEVKSQTQRAEVGKPSRSGVRLRQGGNLSGTWCGPS